MKKPVKKKKTAAKSTRKRKKTGVSDALRAFLLVGVIVLISAVISYTVITIHSRMNNDVEAGETPITNVDDDSILTIADPIIEPHKPDITVSTPSNHETTATGSTGVTTSTTTPSSTSVPSASRPVENTAVTAEPVRRGSLGVLVFVIDDAGNNLRELEPFLRIPGPLTIAVLPGLPYSAEAARRIRAAGKEVFLHQPMEAIGAQNPGPGAIYSGMSAEEIKSILSRNIAEVGPVAGINNHQGSKVTMDKEAMQVILSFCADNGLYFLDSRTTADTVAPAIAQQMGMRIAERNIFIDNEQNKNSMISYIESGLTRAQRSGSAVMIGHAWSPDLAPLLIERYPLFIQQGYSILTASDIIKAR